MKSQRGYTLTELITVVFMLVVLTGIGFGIYAVIHFIQKFW